MTRPNPKHPAPYSDPIIDFIGRRVREEQRALGREIRVLDPFAGVGRIHRIASPGKIVTVGIELEPEWAACHEHTFVGDALDPSTWPTAARKRVDVLATSPCYGNRFADSHNAKDDSDRRSYKHDLGRDLSAGSGAGLAWGVRYRRHIVGAYTAFAKRLQPGTLFVLNVSAFMRGGEVIDAPLFHLGAALAAGFVETKPAVRVATQRMTHGENRERVDGEIVYQLRKA